jgi:trimeric autotransporter adhesin
VIHQLAIKFLHRVRIHGGEFDSSARAMNRAEEGNFFQAELRKFRGSTFERKQMSTTIKRVALVAVAALGLSVLAVAPSQAAPSGDTLDLSATTASTTSGTAATVKVTQTFLAEAGDTMTITAALISFPAGNTVQPAWSSISVVSTDLGSANVDTATARVAKIGSVTGFVNKTLTLSFNGTVAGEYKIRVTPAISNPSGLTPVAGYKDWTVTVAKKTIGWKTGFIGAYSNGTSDTATADATISTTAAASTVAKARIDVGMGYGTVSGAAGETSTAADTQEVVVATDKGLVSKTDDYTAGAKSVTVAAGTTNAPKFFVFSNGDVGKASVTITVGGVLLSTKTVTFTGTAATLAATPTTAAPYWATVGSTTDSTTVTAKDSAGSSVSLPTGLTVKSSDTAVADVTITSGNVVITPKKIGDVTVTVTDPATSGAATAVSFPVHVAPLKSAAAPVISFDKSAYAVGDLVTMTITADMGDKAATLFTAALKASASVVVTSTVDPFASGTTTHALKGGKVVYTFYAPVASGTFTVTGTTSTDVDLTTAAVVSKTVDIVNPGADAAVDAANEAAQAASDATDAALAAADAADAATAAAQDAVDAVAALSAEVNTLIKALKAQITTLTNLVIKIQKKVKA